MQQKDLSDFKRLFDKAAYGNSYDTVFRDFLTMCLCAHSRNFKTGLSHQEDLYMQTIEPYKQRGTLDLFPQLMGTMILLMDKFKDSSTGNDVLGSFYEAEISRGRNGQYFTPWPVCEMMARCTLESADQQTPLRILDPACGSGRCLMATARSSKNWHHYYAIDIDPTCVAMCAINMLFNGMRGEVMCANALDPESFQHSYTIQMLPPNLYRIDKRENSSLWNMNRYNFAQRQNKTVASQVELPSLSRSETSTGNQLQLF